MVLVNKTMGAPFNLAISFINILSNASNDGASFPFAVGYLKRLVSYKSNTEACTLADVPPLVKGDNSLPSILIGLPSLTFTTMGTRCV